MSSDIKSVEDSIKIALDAADVATNVTDEFARITKDYSAVESEVKKIYRSATIVFVSSVAASLIAVVVASMMYYRTMESMETANNTSLEALVIFAENVDKLAASTTTLDEAMQEQEKLMTAAEDANEALARIEAQQEVIEAQQEVNATVTQDGLSDMTETNLASVSQFSSSVLDKIDSDLANHSESITAAIAQLELAQAQLIEAFAAQETASSGAQTPMAEVTTKIEAILMLQREISAKITAANSPPTRTRTAPKAKSKSKTVTPRPKVDDPISFP